MYKLKTTREEFWRLKENGYIRLDYTRREIKEIKNRFWGKHYNDVNRSWSERFQYYPDLSIEGWQHFFDEELRDYTMTDHDFNRLTKWFAITFRQYFCLEDCVNLFRLAFGNVYDKSRVFCLRINQEKDFRSAKITANNFYTCVDRSQDYVLKDQYVRDNGPGVMTFNEFPEFYESLLPLIEKSAADLTLAKMRLFTERGDARIRTLQGTLRDYITVRHIKSSPYIDQAKLAKAKVLGDITYQNRHLWPNFDALDDMMAKEAEEYLKELEEEYGENS